VLAWLSWVGYRWFACCPADATGTSSSIASLKSKMIRPFWWRLPTVFWKKQLNKCYFCCITIILFKLYLLLFLFLTSKVNLHLPHCKISRVQVYKALNGQPFTFLSLFCLLWSSKHPHKSGRSILHCCWSTSVEQSTTSSPWPSTITSWVSQVTEKRICLADEPGA